MAPATATAPNVLDFNRPDSASKVGGEMEVTTISLVTRLRDDAPIATVAGLTQVAEDRKQIGDTIKRVEAFFEPFKKMAYDLHKALCNRETAILTPLKTLDVSKANAIRAYKAAQDELRLKEERRQADLQRQQEQARAAAEAAALETSGDHELAAAVLEEAIAAPAPVVTLVDEVKAAGVSTRRRWLWKFSGGPRLEPKDLVGKTPPAILERSMKFVPREYLCVDVAKVSKYVTAMKGTAKIPGIDVFYVDDPIR